MDLKPLTYNGRDEGIEVTLRTELRPGDDLKNVSLAIHCLFPDAVLGEFETQTFPSKQCIEIECKHLSFETFLEQLRKQSILDTAMDAMGSHMEDQKTKFRISRLAAFAGKIAFSFDDAPLGGCFEIHLEGMGLADWIEACTWHSGRQNVPRQLHDESAMDAEGEASTWHQ
ncbi:MAG: hypothetical protein ACPH9F_01530 [Candidatus Poseidoniaceae archaeon]